MTEPRCQMVVRTCQSETLAFGVNATEVARVCACRLRVLNLSATNGNRSRGSAVDTDVSHTPTASLRCTYHLLIELALFCLSVHICLTFEQPASMGLRLIWQSAIVFTCNIFVVIYSANFSLSLSLSLSLSTAKAHSILFLRENFISPSNGSIY